MAEHGTLIFEPAAHVVFFVLSVEDRKKKNPDVVVGTWIVGKPAEIRIAAPPYRTSVCG
jgi:hypothetical protein